MNRLWSERFIRRPHRGVLSKWRPFHCKIEESDEVSAFVRRAATHPMGDGLFSVMYRFGAKDGDGS